MDKIEGMSGCGLIFETIYTHIYVGRKWINTHTHTHRKKHYTQLMEVGRWIEIRKFSSYSLIFK
jgi:hypothetical protein